MLLMIPLFFLVLFGSYLGHARNLGVNAIIANCKFIGLYELAAAKTGWLSVNNHTLEKTAHGITVGEVVLVYVKQVAEGGTGSMLKTGQFLWAKATTTAQIELSQTPSGEFVAETWTVEVKGTVELQVCTEVSGAPYKRIATAYGAAAQGKSKDTTKHEIPAKEGTVVSALACWEKETGGTPELIELASKPETVGASALYVSNESILDLES